MENFSGLRKMIMLNFDWCSLCNLHYRWIQLGTTEMAMGSLIYTRNSDYKHMFQT